MRFGFFQRKHGFAVRFVQLAQKVLDERVEQEDHRKALNSLALPPERKPSRIGFVAQDDLRFGKQVPGLERNHAQVYTALTILRGDLRGPGQGPCDVLQARVSFQQAPIQQVEDA